MCYYCRTTNGQFVLSFTQKSASRKIKVEFLLKNTNKGTHIHKKHEDYTRDFECFSQFTKIIFSLLSSINFSVVKKINQ